MKVLVIDDDRSWQVYLFSALQAGFELRSAYDGAAALQLVPEFSPDCILLDIHMPGKNGYEICTALKSNSTTAHIPIIILSSKTSMQEKILGFELGAEDYLVKSTEPEFLKAKVVRAVEQYRQKSRLEQGMLEAQSAAFEALSSSADLGCCIRFVERTYSMHSLAQLAEGLLHTMAEFGLRISLMFITPAGPVFFTHGGQDISPLEKEMFIAIHEEGRFCDFGDRTFCNFTWASILIKNMPLNKPEQYGRIKDAVPWVMGTTDAKVQQLNKMANTVIQLNQLKTLLVDVRHELTIAPETLSQQMKEVIAPRAEKLTQMDSLLGLIDANLSGTSADGDTEKSEKGEIFSSGVDFF
jgi:DNA-binding response OmpR family regulator